MRSLAFIFLLGTLTSCGNDLKLKQDRDDSTLSGMVSTIWNNVGISSAHAQSKGDEMLGEVQQFPKNGGIIIPRTPEEIQSDYSAELLIQDFLTSAEGNDYSTLVANALSYAADVRDELPELVTGSEMANLSDLDFPHGIAMALGFDSNKKLISINASPMGSDGSYKIKDAKEKSVSFYKLAFVFEKNAELQFRQSYIFMNGAPRKVDVDFLSSAASIAVTENIAMDNELAISSIKENLNTYHAKVSGSRVQNDEMETARIFLKSEYSMYSTVTPVQRTLLDSMMVHKMRSNPELKNVMNDYKSSLTDDGSALSQFTSTMSESLNPDVVAASEKLASVSLVVKNLMNAHLIPNNNANALIKFVQKDAAPIEQRGKVMLEE